jgi:tetratricopeptide (TPR) repeat protein
MSDANNPSVILDNQHPWPGLAAFGEEERYFFFGRTDEIADLTRMVAQERFILLQGKSGLGKSSLLAAGVSPALRKLKFVPVPVRLNYALERADQSPPLADQIKSRIAEVIKVDRIDAPLPDSDATLWEYFHQTDFEWWAPGDVLLKPVLIFDQFEELLTLGHRDETSVRRTEALLVEIADLIENRPPVELRRRFAETPDLVQRYEIERAPYRIVVALREDFLADFNDLHEQLWTAESNRYRLKPMSEAQALEVVLGPGSHLVTEDVAAAIVRFTSGADGLRPESSPEISAGTGLVDPAILSVFLQALNERRIAQRLPHILPEWVAQAQANEILDQFYRKAMEGMPESVHDFVASLLTSTGVRWPVPEVDARIERGYLDRLIKSHIIQRQIAPGGIVGLELTHDVLAGPVKADREERQSRRVAEAEERLRLEQQRAEEKSRLLDEARSRVENETLRLVEECRQQLEDPSAGSGARVRDNLSKLAAHAEAFPQSRLIAESLAQAEALGAFVLYYYGWIRAGIAAADRAVSRSDSLSGGRENQPRIIRAAALCARGQGRFETGRLREAAADFSSALELLAQPIPSKRPPLDWARIQALTLIGLADCHYKARRDEEADRAYIDYLEWREQLLLRRDPLLVYLAAHANRQIAYRQATYAEAERYLIRVSELSADHEHAFRWRVFNAESVFLRAFGRMWGWAEIQLPATLSEDVRRLQRNLERAKALLESDPDNLDLARIVIFGYRVLGMMYFAAPTTQSPEPQPTPEPSSGKTDTAQTAFKPPAPPEAGIPARGAFLEMRDRAQRVCEREPEWIATRYLNSVAFHYLGDTEANGIQSYRASLRLLRRLHADSPDDPTFVRSMALTLLALGRDQQPQDTEKARASLDEGIGLLRELPPQILNQRDFQEVLAALLLDNGLASLDSGRMDDAVRFSREMLDLHGLRNLSESNQWGHGYVWLARAWWFASAILFRQNSFAAADAAFRKALDTCSEGRKRFPTDFGPLQEETWIASETLRGQIGKGRYWNALEVWKIALKAVRELLRLEPVQLASVENMERVFSAGGKLREAVQNNLDNAETDPPAAKEKKAIVAAVDDLLVVPHPLLPPGRVDAAVYSVAESEAWTMDPLIPGGWRVLSIREQLAESEWLKQQFGEALPASYRVRVRQMDCYPGAAMYEVEVDAPGGGRGILSCIRDGTDVLPIDGGRPTIDSFNFERGRRRLRIESHRQAIEYLLLTTAGLSTGDGTFRVLQSPADLRLLPSVTSEARAKLERLTGPVMIQENTDGRWVALAAVQYGSSISQALFLIDVDGRIEMSRDVALAADQPILTEIIENGLRTWTDLPWRVSELRRRVAEADNNAQRAEAVSAQRELVALIRGSTRTDLQGELLSLSWYQLLTRTYADALATTEEGLRLNPEFLDFQTNRAHALLLLGRLEEAFAIYRANLGKPLLAQPWEAGILEDLDKLEKAGISDPAFAQVQEIMKGAAVQNPAS